MDAVWGGRFVSETAVTSRIKQVRRALGDDGQAQRLIRTVHGRGYRFVADVPDTASRRHAAGVSRARRRASTDGGEEDRPVRYTVSDGLHIAYQVTGGGDLDIVLISGFVSHLDLDWGDPRHAHFLDRLGSHGPADPLRQARHRHVRPAARRARPRDADARRAGRDGRRRLQPGRPLSATPRAARWRSCSPRRTPSGWPAWCSTAATRKRTWAEDYPWAQTPEERRAYTDQLVTDVGLGGRHAAALPVRRRGDAAVVGAADAAPPPRPPPCGR